MWLSIMAIVVLRSGEIGLEYFVGVLAWRTAA
jgi:hypothetical protein